MKIYILKKIIGNSKILDSIQTTEQQFQGSAFSLLKGLLTKNSGSNQPLEISTKTKTMNINR